MFQNYGFGEKVYISEYIPPQYSSGADRLSFCEVLPVSIHSQYRQRVATGTAPCSIQDCGLAKCFQQIDLGEKLCWSEAVVPLRPTTFYSKYELSCAHTVLQKPLFQLFTSSTLEAVD